MGNETSKSYNRRKQNGDFEKFFKGRGIDICCGTDPVTPECIPYDLKHGDAEILEGIHPETFDWVYSSHGLEHLENPRRALNRWWELVRPNGYLILVVPDFSLYEHKTWPSKFSGQHKWCFSIMPRAITRHLSAEDVFNCLVNAQVMRVQLNEDNFKYSDDTRDQTRDGAQAEIEMIFRKHVNTKWV